MKKLVGTIAIIAGLVLGAAAVMHHDEDKTIIDLGKVEIKDEQKAPSQKTTYYYVGAVVLILGGIALVSGKKPV